VNRARGPRRRPAARDYTRGNRSATSGQRGRRARREPRAKRVPTCATRRSAIYQATRRARPSSGVIPRSADDRGRLTATASTLPHPRALRAVWDQWLEGANYLHQFRQPAIPAQIVHVRDMPSSARSRASTPAERRSTEFGHEHGSSTSIGRRERRTSHFDGHEKRPRPAAAQAPARAGGRRTAQFGPYPMAGLGLVLPTVHAAPKRPTVHREATGAKAEKLDLAKMGMTADQRERLRSRAGHASARCARLPRRLSSRCRRARRQRCTCGAAPVNGQPFARRSSLTRRSSQAARATQPADHPAGRVELEAAQAVLGRAAGRVVVVVPGLPKVGSASQKTLARIVRRDRRVPRKWQTSDRPPRWCRRSEHKAGHRRPGEEGRPRPAVKGESAVAGASRPAATTPGTSATASEPGSSTEVARERD